MSRPATTTPGRRGEGDAVPPGWRTNSSAWRQRLPIIGLALVGFAVAGYLTLFQVGAIDTVWEPFFGDGSRTVLTSRISYLLPVPDAALGAAGYLLDAVTGAIGGRRRWHFMPWIVIVFGVAVGRSARSACCWSSPSRSSTTPSARFAWSRRWCRWP